MSEEYKYIKNNNFNEKQKDNLNNKKGRNYNILNNDLSPNTSPIKKSGNDDNIKDSSNFDNIVYPKMKVSNNMKLQINSKGTNNNIINNNMREKNSSKSLQEDGNFLTNGEENNIIYGNSNCEKCTIAKENYKKALNIIRNYVDCFNERLNMIYHKITPQKKISNNSNLEVDFSISPEFYHTLYYSELDKMKIPCEINFVLRSLMKSIRLFNDKYEYISKKHENFERLAQDHKNLKISNKTEDLKNIPDYDVEIKTLEVQKIFQNFNQARESFENTLKDIKSSLNTYERSSLGENKIFESLDNYIENRSDINNIFNNQTPKEPYLKSEVSRLVKENTSLRLELNYIYEQLKEENKIHAIYKSLPNKDTIAFSNSPDINKQRKKHARTDSFDNNSMNNSSYSNPILILPIKNDNKDEKYIIARSYIKRLKNSEYFFI